MKCLVKNKTPNFQVDMNEERCNTSGTNHDRTSLLSFPYIESKCLGLLTISFCLCPKFMSVINISVKNVGILFISFRLA